jgi:release factor glutamine methyltransferase
VLRARLAHLALRARFLLFQKRRHRRLVLESFAGRPLVVLPEVFNPTLFQTTELFASAIASGLVPGSASVLDVGTGSGALAIAAAQLGCTVTAVDVNPHAVRCARINALLNGCEARVTVVDGDIFAPFPDRRFDVVLCNPPFYRGTPRDTWDAAWRAPDFFERFADSLADHLTPSGHALVLLSSRAEADGFLARCTRAGLESSVVLRRDTALESFTLHRIGAAA